MIQEKFKFYKPCKLLQPYIRYYWVFKSNRPLDAFTYPIGCPQIIFHKQAPLYIPELNVTQDKLTVSGQVNFSSHLYADGNTEMIVVVFHPHAMSMFLNIPTSLFYNQEVSGYSLENKSLNELATRIFDCENNSICISYIEKWLVSQIADNLADTTYRIKRCRHTANVYHSANLCKRIIFHCLPEQKAVRAVVSFICRNQSQGIYPYCPLPKGFGADAASSG